MAIFTNQLTVSWLKFHPFEFFNLMEKVSLIFVADFQPDELKIFNSSDAASHTSTLSKPVQTSQIPQRKIRTFLPIAGIFVRYKFITEPDFEEELLHEQFMGAKSVICNGTQQAPSYAWLKPV